MSKLTCFGEHVDRFVREAGGWPDDVIVHTIDTINDQQLLFEGSVPIGTRPDGRPKFDVDHDLPLRVVCAFADYRAMWAAHLSAKPAPDLAEAS